MGTDPKQAPGKTEPEKMQEESETTEQNKDTSELINVDLSSDSILIGQQHTTNIQLEGEM